MAESQNSRLETFCDGVFALLPFTALRPKPLVRSEAAEKIILSIRRQAIRAFWLYLTCTILAFWFPLVVSLVLTLTCLVWLARGATYKEARA